MSSLTPPTSGIMGNVFQAFFGALSSQQQEEMWQSYLNEYGNYVPPVTTPSPSSSSYQEYLKRLSELASFAQGVFTEEQTPANTSPQESAQRKILFVVFDLSLIMLNDLQNSLAVESQTLIYNAQWQEQYTNMLTSVPVLTADPTETMSLNSTDPADTTFGFDNISLGDISSYLISQAQSSSTGTATFSLSGEANAGQVTWPTNYTSSTPSYNAFAATSNASSAYQDAWISPVLNLTTSTFQAAITSTDSSTIAAVLEQLAPNLTSNQLYIYSVKIANNNGFGPQPNDITSTDAGTVQALLQQIGLDSSTASTLAPQIATDNANTQLTVTTAALSFNLNFSSVPYDTSSGNNQGNPTAGASSTITVPLNLSGSSSYFVFQGQSYPKTTQGENSLTKALFAAYGTNGPSSADGFGAINTTAEAQQLITDVENGSVFSGFNGPLGIPIPTNAYGLSLLSPPPSLKTNINPANLTTTVIGDNATTLTQAAFNLIQSNVTTPTASTNPAIGSQPYFDVSISAADLATAFNTAYNYAGNSLGIDYGQNESSSIVYYASPLSIPQNDQDPFPTPSASYAGQATANQNVQESRSEENSQLQQYMENIRSARTVLSNEATTLQTNVTGTQQALSQQDDIITSVVESMKTIVESIFR
jgi:hypothetical protein